jgi:hypothetical protein
MLHSFAGNLIVVIALLTHFLSRSTPNIKLNCMAFHSFQIIYWCKSLLLSNEMFTINSFIKNITDTIDMEDINIKYNTTQQRNNI